MRTPLLDGIKLAYENLNGGFRYLPMSLERPDVQPGKGDSLTKSKAPDIPATLEKAYKSRLTTSSKVPRGPQATSMTASKDNVAAYQSKGAK